MNLLSLVSHDCVDNIYQEDMQIPTKLAPTPPFEGFGKTKGTKLGPFLETKI